MPALMHVSTTAPQTWSPTQAGCYTALRRPQAIDDLGPASTLVGAVGRDGYAVPLTGPDDAMGTGHGQVASASRQRTSDPQHCAGRSVTTWTFTLRRRYLAE